MKAYKYGFELQQQDGTGSTKELIGEYSSRRLNYRLIFGIVVVVIVIVVSIALGVTLNKSKESNALGHENIVQGTTKETSSSVQSTEKVSSVKTDRTTQQTITQTTTSRIPSTNPQNTILTTTDPGKEWIQEPCHSQQKTCPWSSNPVLVVSLDGFRAEYLTRNLTPTLQRLTSCGVHTPYMRAVYPTLTFPNHYTIVTGLYPESHGIVDNNMYDPKINAKFSISGADNKNPAWWGGEPIWVTAKKQGKKTAAYFWVGSEVNISGVMPDIYYAYNGSITYETRVDTVLEWLSWPEQRRPDIMFLYFDEPDHTGHGSGPESPEVDAMLGKVDRIINRLMDGLYRRQIHNCVNLIILADHGMESTSCERRVFLSQYLNISEYLIFDGTIGRIHRQYYEATVGRNHLVQPNPNAPSLEDVKKLLTCKSGHVQMFDQSTIPIRHHYMNNRRIGDLVLDMEKRWTVARNSKTYCLKGNHGFDNLYKSMQALFLAHGPDFRQGIQTDPFENIELYNLMCELLKISPSPNNGTMGSMNHILQNPAPMPTPDTVEPPKCHVVETTNTSADSCFCTQKIDQGMFTEGQHYASPIGQPEITTRNDICVLYNNDSSVGYSSTFHMPIWTSFILQPNRTIENTTGTCIHIDPRISGLSCSSYSNSSMSLSHHLIFNPGFAVKNSVIGNSLSSSIVSMYDGFRDGIWHFTMKLILDYSNQRQGIEVIMGPAFDNNKDGVFDKNFNKNKYVKDGEVPVPSHFYLIVIACKEGSITSCNTDDIELLSFILPHIASVPNCMPDEEYLLENVARIRDIELLTGIQFLSKFPGDLGARLRTFLPTTLWKPSKMSLEWKDLPCSEPQTSTCKGKIPLLLISLDGFRAEYVERKLTPVIEKLRTCGVHTPYMRSVYPTVTFPNHYTIATGLYPESHGIISNNMYDEDIGDRFSLSGSAKNDPRWWGGEPIWNTAKKQGKKAYTYFWPGSDVNISGSYPDIWKAYDGKIGFPERLETVIEWLTMPEDKKPDIITLYFDEPDHAGHEKGPDSEMVNGQLETVDEMLGRLMNTLYQQDLHDCVNLIVIADHGMDHVSCSSLVKLPQYLRGDIQNLMIYDGTFGRIENDYKLTGRTVSKVLRPVQIQKIMGELMCKNSAMKVFTKETIPKRFHYLYNKRIGDILLDMQDQWLVSRTNGFSCQGGNHGWDNLYKAMHALFLAHGPAFKQQLKIEPFENIELYNLMSEIIGINPAPNNGTFGALHHILSKPTTMPPLPSVDLEYNVTQPVALCGCSSVNVNSSDLLPLPSGSIPFGIPVYLHGHQHTRLYDGLASGFRDNKPLWSTVSLSETQTERNHSLSCVMNDIGVDITSCNDYVNIGRNVSLQVLHNDGGGKAGVHFLSSVVPMFNGFKNGIWNYVWQLATDYSVRFGNISVTTGPIYDYNGDGLVDFVFNKSSLVNDNTTVTMPTHFYIIMMKCKTTGQQLPCDANIDVQAFILPHVQETPNCLSNLEYLKDNVARIRDIELLTGLQFLTQNIEQVSAARLRTYLPVVLWPADMTELWLDKPCPSQLEICSSNYQPLILISLDGFRADYLLRNFTPYVRKLSQCGVHAPYMRSVYPTKTFPNHYSIVTGLYPESHGVIDNNMYDDSVGSLFSMSARNASDPRWWKGEPFWNTVRKYNKTSATYFWPGSDVKIQGMYPNIWYKYDGNIPFDTRVDKLLSWLDKPAGQRPDFITLYFDEPDHAGHSYGPDDIPKIGQALSKVDEAVGRLMEGLHQRNLHKCANIIIVADHGMSDTACDKLITVRDYTTQYNNMYIYEGAFGRINLKLKYGSPRPIPVTNPVPLSNIIANMSCRTPHMKVYPKALLPKRHHYAHSNRIDDIIVDVEDTWLFTFRSLQDYQQSFCVGGNHGYDNFYKSMNALFLAHGPAFKQNLIVEPFENIELYNLMSAVLNITGAPNNGTEGSLYELFRHPPVLPNSSHLMDYNRSNSVIDNIEITAECVKQCPSLQNLSKIQDINANSTVNQHTPFGIPMLQSVPRSSLMLLYQPTHITGYDIDIQSPAWISNTLDIKQLTSNPEVADNCVLPDNRVNTNSVNKTNCLKSGSLAENFTWTSLLINGKNQSELVYNRLSSVFIPVYTKFNSGIWNALNDKVTRWLSHFGMINIISGPAYDYDYDGLPDSIDTIRRYTNNTDVAIPSHIFLIITRCETAGSALTTCVGLKTISFILPNIPEDNNCQNVDAYLTDNEARIRDIELLTGLQFFVNYKNHVQLRTFLPHGLWSV